MDNFKEFTNAARLRSFTLILLSNIALAGGIYTAINYWQIDNNYILTGGVIGAILLASLGAAVVTSIITKPFKAVWKALLYVTEKNDSSSAPQLEKIHLGRELVTSMAHQVYDLASAMPKLAQVAVGPKGMAEHILNDCPIPLFALDSKGKIVFSNPAALSYSGITNPTGKLFYEQLNLSFNGPDTLENWITKSADNRLTDSHNWERVKLALPDGQSEHQCAISAHYSKNNPSGFEYVIGLYDIGTSASREDRVFGYLAIAVHELRTPLTVLRGYIEVFEDELEPQLTPELKDFMRKMSVASQQLSAFISNILNVARIEENQMELYLTKANWSQVLPQICQQLEMRAQVRYKKLYYDIEPNLPPVAIDPVSIYEVVSNLIDNAIKYSAASEKIIVHAHLAADGSIVTSVEDFGYGMPDSVIKQLFTKFYRSHLSRSQVAGSGLGLYLVKNIITAHGGEIWVKSKEGQGSTFGFSLQPFSELTQNKGEQSAISRQAHGWIKNHSLYRR